jgi:hypothetical protein
MKTARGLFARQKTLDARQRTQAHLDACVVVWIVEPEPGAAAVVLVMLDVVVTLGGEHEADRRTSVLAEPRQVPTAGLEIHAVVRGVQRLDTLIGEARPAAPDAAFFISR